VSVGAYPEGHPGLGFDPDASEALLVGKARALLAAGFEVHVATQFCFDAQALVRWLRRTRQALEAVRVEVQGERTASKAFEVELRSPQTPGAPRMDVDGDAVPQVCFHVGVAGPTPSAKLGRIASLCEVGSAFLAASAFDLADGDRDGFVDARELRQACGLLGVDAAAAEAAAEAVCGRGFGQEGGARLLRFQFAALLADLSDGRARGGGGGGESENRPASPSGGSVGSGPSACLDLTCDLDSYLDGGDDNGSLATPRSGGRGGGGSDEAPALLFPPGSPGSPVGFRGGGASPLRSGGSGGRGGGGIGGGGDVWPGEVVAALAHYCEAEGVGAQEVRLHLYPFGGMKKAAALARALADGSFPSMGSTC
jgi:hypothetical protein